MPNSRLFQPSVEGKKIVQFQPSCSSSSHPLCPKVCVCGGDGGAGGLRRTSEGHNLGAQTH